MWARSSHLVIISLFAFGLCIDLLMIKVRLFMRVPYPSRLGACMHAID